MRTLEGMRLRPDQLFVVDGTGYFAPHYESDQYTAKELRLIADKLEEKEKK